MHIKKVAAINDLSGIGKCSLTAAIPVISAMSVQACPVPTAVLTNQTGFDSFYMDDCTDKIDKYITEWKKLGCSFDCIYTGFLSSAEQISAIRRFTKEFKQENTILLVDPVMADNGKIYGTYTSELCKELSDFALTADIITPNLTEACLIAGESYDKYSELAGRMDFKSFEQTMFALARKLSEKGPKTVVITGVRIDINNESRICNFAVDQSGCCSVSNKAFGDGYSGTGDIMASVICASLVNGVSVKQALETACRFLERAVEFTFKNGGDRNEGIQFEPFLQLLCCKNQDNLKQDK